MSDHRLCGIYEIVNAVNGRRYIGQSKNIGKRAREHFSLLERGKHHSIIFQRAFKKYSAMAFFWRTVELIPDAKALSPEALRALLTEREQFHMDQTPAGTSYQVAPAAGSLLGFKHTPEARAKLSLALKGRVFSPEHKAKISAALRISPAREMKIQRTIASNKARIYTPEMRERLAERGRNASGDVRKRIADTLRGRRHSAAARAKMSASRMGVKRSPESVEKSAAAHRGRKQSAAARAKMSAANRTPHAIAARLKAHLGRKRSAETIAKLRAVKLGKKHTPESRAKMSASQTGRQHSAETREKMAATGRARYAALRAAAGLASA